MTMSPGARKLALTVHVTTSVGWLGAVAAFLALALTGARAADALMARAAYLAMDRLAWCLILPLCGASLASGIVQALGTPWGLLRHYWVAIKLAMTLLATLVLLAHMRPIGAIAAVAAVTPLLPGALQNMRLQLVVDAGAALIVLAAATALSVYRPRGVTPYGRSAIRREAIAQGATRPRS